MRNSAETRAVTWASDLASSGPTPESTASPIRCSDTSLNDTAFFWPSDLDRSAFQVLSKSPSKSSIWRLPLNLSRAVESASLLSWAILSLVLCSSASLPASCNPISSSPRVTGRPSSRWTLPSKIDGSTSSAAPESTPTEKL